ncbi:MAG: adenylosuccinate synthetase [Fermentimonas sp.]|nr:adenylosuccinate synthetase [Fermentimonas sp.]
MVEKKALIIVGLGFGDEGKGLATDYLCLHNPDSIVVKYNGGHQSAHHVITKEGKNHIFSQFGAGSFRNIPTYRSKYCTFEPMSFINELKTLGSSPTLYIDEECPVTTYFDILFNQLKDISNTEVRIGSTGTGYRTTIERQKHLAEKLTFKNLFIYSDFENKLERIQEYYRTRTNLETCFIFDSFNHEAELEKYYIAVEEIKKLILNNNIVMVKEEDIFLSDVWKTYIFEGSQGILLDQNYGTKPHITLSNTTSQNAQDMIKRYNEVDFSKTIYYVTRAYQTRHGHGPFREKSHNFILINNCNESNQINEFQGVFKTNFLDIDQLNYALECDNIYSNGVDKNLLITCLDHFTSEIIKVFEHNNEVDMHYTKIPTRLNCKFKNVIYSFNGCAEFL